MNTPTPPNWVHLERRPESFYRQLFLKGRRIRAEIIEMLHDDPEEPQSVEQLAADYDLPLEAVQEALAYCRSNPPEIAGDRLREEALVEARGMKDDNGQPRLLSPQERERIRQLRAPGETSQPTMSGWAHLEARPSSFYRQLFLKGGRIRAEIIYDLHTDPEEPQSVEQLAADYDLPLEAVQEAIAYCRSNPPEIAGDRRREEALMEATGMYDPNYNGQPRVLSPEERARIRTL